MSSSLQANAGERSAGDVAATLQEGAEGPAGEGSLADVVAEGILRCAECGSQQAVPREAVAGGEWPRCCEEVMQWRLRGVMETSIQHHLAANAGREGGGAGGRRRVGRKRIHSIGYAEG